jgi:hypothetical protein
VASHRKHCATRLIGWTEYKKNLVLVEEPAAKEKCGSHWQYNWRNAGVHEANGYD